MNKIQLKNKQSTIHLKQYNKTDQKIFKSPKLSQIIKNGDNVKSLEKMSQLEVTVLHVHSRASIFYINNSDFMSMEDIKY